GADQPHAFDPEGGGQEDDGADVVGRLHVVEEKGDAATGLAAPLPMEPLRFRPREGLHGLKPGPGRRGSGSRPATGGGSRRALPRSTTAGASRPRGAGAPPGTAARPAPGA